MEEELGSCYSIQTRAQLTWLNGVSRHGVKSAHSRNIEEVNYLLSSSYVEDTVPNAGATMMNGTILGTSLLNIFKLVDVGDTE